MVVKAEFVSRIRRRASDRRAEVGFSGTRFASVMKVSSVRVWARAGMAKASMEAVATAAKTVFTEVSRF
jgi:hypothetical protein